jgi:cytochrome c oxidase cbb3-type subunit 1
LALGSLLSVLGAIKAHAPGFLAGWSTLTFGRVLPAGTTAVLYGFTLQAGFGAAIWMLCRLGRNRFVGGLGVIAGAAVWNIAVLVGVAAILADGSSGYDWLDLPKPAGLMLCVASVIISGWALVSAHFRRVRPMYVSQWLIVGALLWFPWVFTTAVLLLLCFPARGVLQAVFDGWYRHNLAQLCLGSFGLATIFYFIPKLRRRPLYGEQLALCGFWLLILFGGWGGVHRGVPSPNWISGVSDVGRVLLLVPALVFGMSWYQTTQGAGPASNDLLWRFISLAALSYLLGQLLAAATVLPGFDRITQFTTYDLGVDQLWLHGFIGLAMAGAIYFIAPRLTNALWPAPGLIKLHFWCAAIGTLLSAGALVGGGLLEGARLEDPKTAFIDVIRSLVPFLGMSTLGNLLLFVGYAIFFVHLSWLLKASCGCSLTLPGGWLKGALAKKGGA